MESKYCKKLATLDPGIMQLLTKLILIARSGRLEVCIQSGEKYSSLRKFKHQVRSFNIIKIGLMPEKEHYMNESTNVLIR